MAVYLTDRGKQPLLRPLGPFRANANSVLSHGLLAWWPGSSPGGSFLPDMWRGSYHATMDANLAYTTTRYGWAINNPSDNVENNTATPNNQAGLYALPQTYNFAISLWAAAFSFADNRAVVGIGGTDDLMLYPYDTISGHGPRVFWRDVGGSLININTGVPAADGTDHHFCFVSYASNDHRLFIDGVQAASSSATGTAGPFDSFRLMGWADNATQRFHGVAHDICVYNIAPTAAQIYAMWNPASRWDLYARPSTRVYFDIGAAPPAARLSRLSLMGVG